MLTSHFYVKFSIFILIASISCTRGTCYEDMDDVLSLAGDNRGEIVKVLDYYNAKE